MGFGQACLTVTIDYKYGLQIANTYTGGGGPAVTRGKNFSVSKDWTWSPNARKTDDYGGPFGYVSGSIAPDGPADVGCGFSSGNTGTPGDDRNVTVFPLSTSLGLPGGEVHSGASNTKVDHNPLHILALAYFYVANPLGL
jgi:hypothetical protein